MTSADMVNAFGAESASPSDSNLDHIHDAAWSVFNTYGDAPNTKPGAQTALTALQAAYGAVNQLVARITAPGPL